MEIENSTPPTETPEACEIPPANPPPPAAPAPGAPAEAAPPAAALVVNGEVTDERVLAAERRARDAEFRAAEVEQENQRLKEIQSQIPAPAATPKKKVKRYLISPLIGADEEIETE